MLTLLLPASRGTQDAALHAQHLSTFLTQRLERTVKVEVASDYAELERRLLRNEVDLAWAPPILCARAEPTARGILSAIRVGRSSYRSALVGRKADGLVVDKLGGKTAAWTDPLSTGGYLLASAFLTLLGQPPEKVFKEQRFLGNYSATLEAVVNGEADVTAIYTPRAEAGAVRQQMEDLLGPRADALVALAFTEEVPADGLVVGQRVAAADAGPLLEQLLSLGTVGRNPLMDALAAERLVPARDGDYRPLRHAAQKRG